jgi:RsiW-degrading membrane proteinase PrsW (M82 family)
LTTCPACGKRLKAKDELAGRVLPCPNCKQNVSIPEPGDEVPVYLVEPEQPAEQPERSEPPPEPLVPSELDPEPAPVRRRPRSAPFETIRRKGAPPPLSTNEMSPWVRHLHWLLVLALLPLTFSLLTRDEWGGIEVRLKKTLEDEPEEVKLRVARVLDRLEKGEASVSELFDALPEGRFVGALLPRRTFVHWAFAAWSAVAFMSFFLFLAVGGKTAEPLHLLGMGLFTATVGVLLLLVFQFLANVSQGVWLRGANVVVVIFYVVKLIGFSYRAALDPNYGFFLSFMGFTLGVGFCEEVCKALPLLVLFRRSSVNSWRTVFLWGLASGAGFGISEGILYSSQHYNGVAGFDMYLVRFVSCVALHALWTGSVGITLYHRQDLLEGVDHWYEYIPRLVLIVGVPMVLHGLYDTLLKKEMNALALGVAALSFVFLAFQISHLHGEDDAEARKAMRREYKRRRAAIS